MGKTTYRARWILPVERPPIENGYLVVEDDSIAELGKATPATGSAQDLGDVVLMPGLVNVHTHLEFSQLARPLGEAQSLTLPEWIRLVIAERKRKRYSPATAIQGGLRESLAAGVTTLGEISTSPPDAYAGPANLMLFQEVIGFSTGRIESVFGELEARLNVSTHFPMGISPHAPYTVHPDLLRRIVALARQRNLPVAMHLAESPEELDLLQHGRGLFQELLEARSMWDPDAIPPGTTIEQYLAVLADAPRGLVIHGNYLSQSEIKFLAARPATMAVVYCPRTHNFFGHRPYPLEQLLAAGVTVALGTDSRASNPDLRLLDEARLVAAKHTGLSAQRIVELATLAGARALGMANRLGSLAPGKQADIIAIPCSSMPEDPYDTILSCDTVPSWCCCRGFVIKDD